MRSYHFLLDLAVVDLAHKATVANTPADVEQSDLNAWCIQSTDSKSV